ncbi:MocR-like transcription factor YczR [Egicoccus halophilus]|uniref:GntR family transcriptional regulator n=1 Tax=Egicoccus halophilus TaxID=1670830 RepID=A0A8J3EVG6_9ACTN|nr:PLP-dependent aminotransferase family protein [Egicoccus halophilus]GGI09100.1 GntR family transcriptional regulator [Egicoccus halophilus]
MEAYELRSVLGDWQQGTGRPADRLTRAVQDAVDDGRLAVGTRLPAERPLAEALQVSRGLVARVYGRLREQGVVHTRHGSGTVVGSAEDRTRSANRLAADGLSAAVAGGALDGIDLRIAAWDADEAVVADLYVPSTEQLRAAARDSSGYWPLGHPWLRRAIAEHATRQGLPTDPEQVLVTAGAQQAVDVLLTALLVPGDPVLVEEVSWPGLTELLTLRHLRASIVPETAVDPVALLRALRERRADVAFLIPSHHNPTGTVLPAHVRRQVVEAAAEGGVLLIDDLTFHELWIDEPPPAPLAAIVPELADSVVSVGSLSKLVWGGVRVGWIRAEPALLPQLVRIKTALDLGMSLSPQLAAAEILGRIEPMLVRRRGWLRERRDVLVEALHTGLPDWRFTPPAGGMSMWVDLGGVSGDVVAAAAAAHRVLVPPARACSTSGRDLDRIRLTLSRPPDELREAVRRLALAWDDVRGGRLPRVGMPIG